MDSRMIETFRETFGIIEIGLLIAAVIGLAGAVYQGFVSRKRVQLLLEEVRRARQEASRSYSDSDDDRLERDTIHQIGQVPQVDQGLVTACVSGNCVLFSGAGLGVPAGFPSWRQLLSRIVDQLEETDPDSEWSGLRAMLSRGQEEEVADILKHRSSPDQLVEFARNAARGPREPEIPPALALLAELNFRGVASTTWDGLVQRAFRFDDDAIVTSRGSIDVSRRLRDRSSFLVKPYGVLDDLSSLIFTHDEYKEAVVDHGAYAKFIGTLCTTNSFLFMGTSLDTIEAFFESSGVRPSPDRYHYALVPRGESSSLEEERLLAKYNLKVSTFQPSAEWEEVVVFARNLRDAVQRASAHVERPPVAPQVLKKVTLVNIGPFQKLELELAPVWTILLGDNGCGKSTILRSIALALAGNDERARRAGDGLLRSGTESGWIELVIGKGVYRTTLSRDGNRVLVKPESFTPVQAGTWLVLGFPALRGNESRTLDGAGGTPQTAAPSVDDLLPLLNNEVDPRFDDLRQWLLNTTISAERAGKENREARNLSDAFLDTLRRLTPGVTMHKLTYREDPWEVVVKTDDGDIPIGMMSQGMSSVFAWVGTLLRRLNEVYAGTDDASRRECLVLNDEIGAHLHPEWQGEIQSLIRGEVDALASEPAPGPNDGIRSAIFPNVQVIATTHSPLIVANARAGEVFYLRRPDPEAPGDRRAGQPKVTRIEHSFEGWRADQILTAPAFGMDYARDRKTRLRLQRYEALFTKAKRSRAEQLEMEGLADELDETVLPRHESPEKRQAVQLVTEWMKQRLTELPEEQKVKVLSEAERYLAELEGG
jgi:energy-coupling factor transporter ATP-binding protein EcfA2